jgi:Skp family chaperone for outer membrane proteins
MLQKFLLFLAFLFGIHISTGWTQTKIGYLDVTATIEKMPEAKSMCKQFSLYLTKHKQTLVAWYHTVNNTTREEPNLQDTLLSKLEIQAYLKELEAMEKEYQRRLEDARWGIQNKVAELLELVVQKVNDTAKVVAAELGLTLVVNTSGCPFDPWHSPNRVEDNHYYASGMEQALNEYLLPPPCIPHSDVLFLGRDAMDIAPLVLKKMGIE